MMFFRSHILLLFLIAYLDVNAQTFTATDYYYNNFNGGSLGGSLSQIGSNASWEITPTASANNLATDNGYALRSKGDSKSGGLAMSALPSGTNLDSQIYGHEWTMLFKSNVNAANSDVIENNEDAWRYWLFAENSNLSTARGYFLTQEGTTIHLRWKYSNSTATNQYNTLISFNLSSLGGNGKTYAIRVQRLRRQGQATWNLFIDEYTTTKKEATTKRGNTSYESSYGTYNYSALLCSSTAPGNFMFDDLKVYAIQLKISGANDSVNGISNPLVPGQANAAIYGLQIQIRGLLDVYQLRFSLSGNITSIIEANTVKLYRSVDDFYGNADDVFVVNMDCYDGAIQKYGGLNETFYSTGDDDGSLATVCYYYISANVKNSPNTNVSFAFTGAPEIIGQSSQNNYSNSGSVSNAVTEPESSGVVYTWVAPRNGSSDNWNTSNNWSPVGVPGPNDVALIGNANAFYQPRVTANTTVGNIIFSNAKNFTLTIAQGATLTVKSSVTAQKSASIEGDGTLDIKGTWISSPENTTAVNINSTVKNIKISNLSLNSFKGATTFSVDAGTLTLASGYRTLFTNKASSLIVGNAKIVFKGVTSLTLAPGNVANNLLDFTAGSVEYASEANQVIHGSGLSNYSGSVLYKDLVFSGSGKKNVQAGNLNITGNWLSSGGKIDLTTNSTNVTFSGANQTITDLGSDLGKGLVFSSLSISGTGSKTLSTTGKFAVVSEGVLSISGSATMQTSDNLTLKSDANGAAQVAAIPTSASIRGKVVAERYVQGGNQSQYRTYRMLSSPVYDNTSSFLTSGVRSYKVSQLIDDIIITGAGGATNGFDASANNNATAFTYGSSFLAVTSISQNINVGTGLYLFYRGNRSDIAGKTQSTNGNWPNPENTVLTFEGILNQQDVVVPLGGVGYKLVGNPYAATIDWNAAGLTKTGLENKVWIWNPHIKQYAVLAGTQSTNSANRYITSGQSFFVKTTVANASITFTEQAKAVSQQQKGLDLLMDADASSEQFKLNKTMSVSSSSAIVPDPVIRMKMSNPTTFNEDEAVLVLQSGGNSILTEEDAVDMDGEGVFLSTYSSDNKRLAINYMDDISSFSKVDLYTSATTTGDYQLTFEVENLPSGYEIYLIDSYSKINKVISNGETITFTVNRSDAASFAPGRMQLSVRPATTLPIQLVSFTGKRSASSVSLNWKAIADAKHSHFYISKTDGNKVETIKTGIIESTQGDFNLVDQRPFVGNNYYTLMQVDKDGKETAYGPIVVKFDLTQQGGLTVYPNPVVENCIVQVEVSESNLLLEVSDIVGNKKFQSKASNDELNLGKSINLANLASGIYFVSIKNQQGKTLATTKIIKK